LVTSIAVTISPSLPTETGGALRHGEVQQLAVRGFDDQVVAAGVDDGGGHAGGLANGGQSGGDGEGENGCELETGCGGLHGLFS
jgi:hypothetical protein